MNIALTIIYWVLAAYLAFIYLAGGWAKVSKKKDDYVASGMGWAKDVSPAGIRTLGVLEIAGVLGLVLPPVTHIAPVLAPIAAIGLVIVQIGAITVHVRAGQKSMLGKVNVPLLIAAALEAIIGFIIWV